MKNKFLKKLSSFAKCGTLLLSLTAHAHALERGAMANLRDENQVIVQREVILRELNTLDAFEGKYFKIVHKQSNDPIRFDADPALVLKAATAYHHLMIARDYFTKEKRIEQPHLNDQITIRLEQDRQFSQFIHFKNADQEPKFELFNLSLTIPESNDFKDDEVQAWGPEIWFHAAKPMDRKTQWERLGETINSRQFKNPILAGLLLSDAVTALGFYLDDNQFDDIDAKYTAYSVALSVALSEVIPWVLELGTKLFTSDYSLDTVMIPEVIYHEYAHIALKKHFGLFQPTPLLEGYPNYFASKISGLLRLADEAGDYNNGDTPKDGEDASLYTFEHDHKPASSHGSFVFSLLLDLEEALGEQGSDIVVSAVKRLDAKSDLKQGLQKAIIDTIQELGKNKLALKLRAQAVFRNRGF